MGKRTYWLLLAALLIVGFWELAVLSHHATIDCVAQPYPHQKYCDPLSFGVAPFVWFWDFLGANKELLGALGTGVIAYFTFTLYRATSGLKDSTDKLWAAGEQQAAINKEAADAARDAAKAANESASLTRRTFIASNRARLIARRFMVVQQANSAGRREIHYSIINAGATAAESFVAYHAMYIDSEGSHRSNPPPYPAFDVANQEVSTAPLDGGKASARYIQIRDGRISDPAALWGLIEGSTWTLYTFGTITYVDGNGVKRQMGFMRKYDPTTQRFRICDDPDYEYQD